MAEMGLLKQIVLDNMEQGQIIRIVSEAGVWQGAEVEQGHLT